MSKYVSRRLAWAVPQILGVLVLVFVVIHLLPGNPARAILGSGGVTAQFIQLFEKKYHLNDSIPVQFWAYISSIFRGDLGISLANRQPVAGLIWAVLPNTALLAGGALCIGWPLGVGLGGIAARRQGRLTDTFVSAIAAFLLSVPSYFLALFLLYEVSFRLRLLPAAGDQGLRSFILPCFTLALIVMAVITRVSRSSTVDAALAEHVSVARANGLGRWRVWRRHVMRNALIPSVTIGGIAFGELLGGAVFVETIFLRPGIGRLAVTAIRQRDYPLVQGIILVIAAAWIVINLLVDIAYALLDPQFRDSLQPSGV